MIHNSCGLISLAVRVKRDLARKLPGTRVVLTRDADRTVTLEERSALANARIYAGLNVQQFGSLVRSSDGGATWTDLSASLPIRSPGTGGVVSNIAISRADPDTVYISMWDTSTPAQVGVFSNTDAAQTWSEVGHLAARVAGPSGLLYDSATQTLYAATDSGVYRYFLAQS